MTRYYPLSMITWDSCSSATIDSIGNTAVLPRRSLFCEEKNGKNSIHGITLMNQCVIHAQLTMKEDLLIGSARCRLSGEKKGSRKAGKTRAQGVNGRGVPGGSQRHKKSPKKGARGMGQIRWVKDW